MADLKNSCIKLFDNVIEHLRSKVNQIFYVGDSDVYSQSKFVDN